MRRIIDTTEKVTTVNKETLQLLKRAVDYKLIYDLVENSTDEEAAAKITQFVNKRINKKFPNLAKSHPLVFERYADLLANSIQEKVEECLMPMF